MIPTTDLPPLDALRVFELAARHQSFNEAAKALHLTPSAVSHRMRALEDLIGVPLFERRVRAVRLTERGRAYAATVAESLALLREATRRLKPGREDRPFTVSCSPAFAARWLLPRLAQFEAANPAVVVHIVSTSKLANFTEDGVDAALRVGEGRWPGLAAHRLMPFDLIPICAPALLRGPKPLATPADLKFHTLLHSDQWPEAWRIWLHAAGLHNIDPIAGRHFSDMAMATDAAKAGLGIALSARALLRAELAERRLAVPFDKELPTGRSFYLVYPELRASDPRIAAFRDWVCGEFAADGRATRQSRAAGSGRSRSRGHRASRPRP